MTGRVHRMRGQKHNHPHVFGRPNTYETASVSSSDAHNAPSLGSCIRTKRQGTETVSCNLTEDKTSFVLFTPLRTGWPTHKCRSGTKRAADAAQHVRRTIGAMETTLASATRIFG